MNSRTRQLSARSSEKKNWDDLALGDSDKTALFSRLRGSYRVSSSLEATNTSQRRLKVLNVSRKNFKEQGVILTVNMDEVDSGDELPFDKEDERRKRPKVRN